MSQTSQKNGNQIAHTSMKCEDTK